MFTALARALLLVIATVSQNLSVEPSNPALDEVYQERFHKPTDASALWESDNAEASVGL